MLSGISCVVTVLAQKKGEALGLLDVYPPMMRLGNAAVSYVKYIQKMFWPDQLAVLYPYPKVIVGRQVLAAFVMLGCITFLVVRYRKRLPWLFVNLGTAFLAAVVVSSATWQKEQEHVSPPQ